MRSKHNMMKIHESKEILNSFLSRNEFDHLQCVTQTKCNGCAKDLLKSSLWTGNGIVDEGPTEGIELFNVRTDQEFALLKGVRNWEKHEGVAIQSTANDTAFKAHNKNLYDNEEETTQNTAF